MCVIKACSDQVSCDLVGEAVILNLKSGVYYGLDSVGTLIWNLVQEPKTVTEIRKVVLEEYDVDPQTCERDIQAFLEDMAAHGIVTMDPCI